MEKFSVYGILVENISDSGLSLGDVDSTTGKFATGEKLQTVASKLLNMEKYKDKIVYYDGCLMYNIKNET